MAAGAGPEEPRAQSDLGRALAALDGYLRRRPLQALLAVKAIGAAQWAWKRLRLAGAREDSAGKLEWAIRSASVPVVAVVPPNWLGVTTSTRNGFPNVLFCSDQQPEPGKVAEEILRRGFSTVVFSDVPGVFPQVARALRARSASVRLLVHYHGSLVQNVPPEIRQRFRAVLDLARGGMVEKVGCAKAGMADVLQRMGVRACYLPYRVERPGQVTHRAAGSPRKVGVFVREILLKNVYTQSAAACLLRDVEVHVNDPPDLSCVPSGPKVVAHGKLPYEEFLHLLGQMDLNLYASLSECYPMVVVESLIRGVPCLTSHTHEIFAHDRELGELLIVPAHDNPVAIAEQAERVLADREAIGRRCEAYALELNRCAEALLNEFVGFGLYGSAGRDGWPA
jgi:glycosyltransferase involved in cell wall biosynthesis